MKALLSMILVCLALLPSGLAYSDNMVFDCPDDKFNRVVVELYENIKDDDKFDSESLCIPDSVNKINFLVIRLIEIKSIDALYDLYRSGFFPDTITYRGEDFASGAYIVMQLIIKFNSDRYKRFYHDYDYNKNIASSIVDFINSGVVLNYVYYDFGVLGPGSKLLGSYSGKYEYTIDEIERVIGSPDEVMENYKQVLFELMISSICNDNKFNESILDVVKNIQHIDIDTSLLSRYSLVYDSSFFMGANYIARSMGGFSYSEECVRLFYGKIK
ncbi:hypothetical protein [Nitrincola sp. MINF-07-Sa-05]|uniref:hypothetical protein n=1 Tax=Nitrincola salilacus TaxID=3400273 RepID=UPI003917DEAD